MGTTSLHVPGIHCDHCKAAIEGAVGELAGVRSAEVDVAARSVTVDYDEGAVKLEAIKEAIIEQGYDLPA
jgi:copper chaperone